MPFCRMEGGAGTCATAVGRGGGAMVDRRARLKKLDMRCAL